LVVKNEKPTLSQEYQDCIEKIVYEEQQKKPSVQTKESLLKMKFEAWRSEQANNRTNRKTNQMREFAEVFLDLNRSH